MEEFFKNYQYTLAAIGAMGTLLAVIMSLWLANNSTRIKVKINSTIKPINGKESICIKVTNIGMFPIYFGRYSWLIFKAFKEEEMALDSSLLNYHSDVVWPAKIMPNMSLEVPICTSQFLKKITEISQKSVWYRWFGAVYIKTNDGSRFKIQFAGDFARSIRNAKKVVVS